ncbi:MAG: C10 family peptidase [Muribaculaceae bacterium]|nr:C10 family peptidase [Muribaculaceae bacterium]
MKKQMTFILAGVSLAFGSAAAPLTPEQALARFRSDAPAKIRAASLSDMQLKYTAKSDNGSAAAYVFARPEGRGFAILSADDLALPVLGYSDSAEFDANAVPPQLKWWLSECGRRVEYLASKGISAESDRTYAPSDWTVIDPLCTTRWNQGAPYNLEAPLEGNTQCPTGCVATSFAQAMNYFKYPERGQGVLQYKWGTKTLRLNLDIKAIEWDQMLDEYTGSNYTEEQAAAVAYLMKACGYAVEMNYGANSSGAMSYKLINALVNNFNYDPNVTYEDRLYYSTTEWSKLIYDNLKNCGPVIYDGTALEGGHSFICDGYDGEGYFHFNWGWGGMSDGYYLLDVLNPEAQGTGGAVGGFNWGQNAVIGMQKPTGEPVKIKYGRLSQYGNTVATLSGNTLNFGVADYSPLGWGNGSYSPVYLQIGAMIENLAGGDATYAAGGMGSVGSPASLNVSTYYPYTNVHPVATLPSGLADGVYRVTLVTKDLNYEDAPWLPVLVTYGYSNYCILTVEGGKYTVANAAPLRLTFENVSLNKTLYQDKNTMLRATVTNNTDLDLSQCIQPMLVKDGVNQFGGDMMMVSAEAGESTEQQWIVKFYRLTSDYFPSDTEYTLQLIDKTSGTLIGSYGTVVMQTVSGNLSVNVDEFKVEGASTEDIEIGSRTFKNTYMVTDAENVEIVLDYTVLTGYFDSSLTMGVQWYNPATGAYQTYLDNIYREYPFIGKGESDQVKVNLNMFGAPSDGVYTVRATYVLNGVQRSMATMSYAIDKTGVDGVTVDDDQEAEYFTLQGVRIDGTPEKGQVVISRKNGTARKIIF